MMTRPPTNNLSLPAAAAAYGPRPVGGALPAASIPISTILTNKNGELTLPIPGNPFTHAISLSLLFVFLFLAYSRILDYTFSSLHLPLIVSTLTLCFALFSGGLFRIFRSLTGILMLLFLGWMTVCVPFAFWKGGSVMYLEDYSKSFLVLMLLVASLSRTRHVMLACYSIAFAMIGVILLCFTIGSTDETSRLTLVTGLLGNSNDLAQVLLVGIPFWILFGNARKGMFMRSFVAGTVILVMLYLIMKTGSRAVMLGVMTATVMYFLSVSFLNKLKLATAGAVGVAVLMLSGQGALQQRYATLFSSENSNSMVTASALASTSQRTELFKRSVALTLRHPLFGVGPGNFKPASVAEFGNEQGTAWYDTHNTMTQISSEVGIPGLVLFCAALLSCFHTVWKLSRWKAPAGQPISPVVADHIHFINRMGSCLLLSLTSLTLTSLFSSIAYHIFFPTLIGLCAALQMATKEEFKILFPPATQSPQPAEAAFTAPPNTAGRLRPAL